MNHGKSRLLSRLKVETQGRERRDSVVAKTFKYFMTRHDIGYEIFKVSQMKEMRETWREWWAETHSFDKMRV